MRIYLTHCSAKKALTPKTTKGKLTPDQLYTSQKIQGFMKECKIKKVKWAIFSDLYGVFLPHEKRSWYEKHPDKVSKEEFEALVENFDTRLEKYEEIWFYYHPARFHPLYRSLLQNSSLKKRIKIFSKKQEII